MNELAHAALNLTALLMQKSMTGTLNEYEAQLYEAGSRFSTTVLNFSNATSQSAMIEVERHLDEINDSDGRGTDRSSA